MIFAETEGGERLSLPVAICTRDTFSICNLMKCYIKHAEDFLRSRMARCVDNIHAFERDLVWTTINVIRYLIHFNQFEEAQRILEEINYCNNICRKQDRCTEHMGIISGGCACGPSHTVNTGRFGLTNRGGCSCARKAVRCGCNR